MDRFLFWDLLCQWLLLRGKAFLVALDHSGAVISLQATGRLARQPARLVLLNPDRVRTIIAHRELAGYHYDAGLHDPIPTQPLLPHEVISLRMAYAYNSLEGLPPLGIAMLAAQTDHAAAQCMKGLMLNNADAGVIVTTDKYLNSDQREQVVASLRERKRKAGTADRPLFLTDGAKVQQPTLSLAGLQFLENRKFNRQEICAVFRVPQEILGYTEDANRAVADAVRQNFIENRIAPFCQRLESAVDPIVKLFDPELWGFFDVESLPIMQSARRLRYQGARQGFEMGVPLEVLNQVFDLGLPALPQGGTPAPGVMDDVREPGAEPVDDLEKMLARTQEKETGSPAPLLLRQLESKLSKYFFEQRARTLSRLEEKAATADGDALDGIFPVTTENERLMQMLTPVLKANLGGCAAGR